MKILFVMGHFGYVRNYEGVLRHLAAQGHRIHLAAELARNKMGEDVLGQALAAEFSVVTMGHAAVPEDNIWTRAARIGRLLVDALRYAEPQFRAADALRTRALRTVPRQVRPFLRGIQRLGWPFARFVRVGLCRLERVMPLSADVTAFIRQEAPDVLLITPLVEPGSIQVDYIKSARALGIPSALCVASWDNLTNKGAMRVVPDRVIVWNEAQAKEAVELHGVQRASVVVTGAQIFDHWFSWQPSRTREEFCAMLGFDPARPIVLYVGSSFFIAPNEAEFGLRWLSALRAASDREVAGANVLIRPHPSNAVQWSSLELESWPRTALWPPAGADFFAPQFKHDFFDSLYFSDAVVGVNTSAQIDAAIVGRVVATVASADFAHSQAGTLHFQHLVRGGLLEIARDFDAHIRQLGTLVRDREGQAKRARQFVESFVRPFGLDQPATPRVVTAIADLAAQPVRTYAPDGLAARAAQRMLQPLAWFVATMPDRRPWWVYVLRPVLFLAIQAWALPYRVGHGMRLIPRLFARVQRTVAKAWHWMAFELWREGVKHIRSRSRHLGRRVRANMRLVSARMLRVITK